MTTQNAMFCYRPDNTCYAIIAPGEWERLRKAGKLDAELKRRRESGVILEVVRPETKLPVKHFKPRENTRVVQAEAPILTVERVNSVTLFGPALGELAGWCWVPEHQAHAVATYWRRFGVTAMTLPHVGEG